MKLQIKYKANKHQDEFHKDIVSKFLHLSGGYGSGKTHGLMMKMLNLSWLNKPYPGGLVVPSLPDYKKDVLPLFLDILETNRIKFGYHQTDFRFNFPWTRGGLYIQTAEKKIRGPNWAYAGINELTLIPLMRYRETVSRVRIKGAPCPQIASSGTPEGLGSEYYQVFVEKPWDGARIIYGDTRDNAENLGPDYVKSLESSFDSVMLEAYLAGQFVNLNGNRFYYAYDPKRNEDQSIERDNDAPVHISLDFNVNPMIGTCWHHDGSIIRGFDEIVLDDPIRGADTNQMALAMIARGYTPANTIIYPDPAGQARSTKGLPDIQILRNHGFQEIKVRKQAPGMRQRQLNMNNLLEKGSIVINPLKCKAMRKDLIAVEQDKVTLEKIKKNPSLTHASDGADYLCDILFPYSGVRSKPEVVKYR